MGIYDIALKDIFRNGGRAFLRARGVPDDIKSLDTDLSSVKERRVDFLAEVSPDRLVHIEFQANPHGAMRYRMLSYLGSIIERVTDDRQMSEAAIDRMNIQVRQVVVYAGLKPWRAPKPIELPGLKYGFEFVDMKHEDPIPLLRDGDASDAVLALLCSRGASRDMIRAILTRIAHASKEERPDAVARLIALASLRDARVAVEREVRDMGMQFNLADSALLREPIDQARQEGFQAGESRGLAKGYASTIAMMLRLNFGPDGVPDDLVEHLADLQPDVLSAMVARIQGAPSVEHVLGSHMPAASGYRR